MINQFMPDNLKEFTVPPFWKIVRVGTQTEWHNRVELPTDIYCEIKYRDNKLSITGVVGPRRNGDAWGSCGQIDMGYDHKDKSQNDSRTSSPITAKDITFAKGWNADLWYGFLNIWHNWHLNDLKAACEHQTLMGWDNTRMSEPCPICGYKYGHEWNRVEIPLSVLEFLAYLPDSDKSYPWED